MLESEDPDRLRRVGETLDRLEQAVDRICEQTRDVRERASRAEAEHRRLFEAVEKAGGDTGPGLAGELTTIAADNERLRATLSLAKEKARRISARLAVVEDDQR